MTEVVYEGKAYQVCSWCFSQEHDFPDCSYLLKTGKPALKIIKTFHPQNQMVSLRADNNANDFAHFRLLAEEAKYDFPGLRDSEIMVEKYAGTNYVGTYVIEFVRKDAPSEYERIERTKG